MSLTRANWHLDALRVDESDPFVAVQEVGELVVIRDDRAELVAAIEMTLRREQRLDAAGVTCPIKGAPGVCCSACPIARTDNMDPVTALCALGREQESLLTRDAVARSQDGH